MAITKIHAIRSTIQKSVDYICNPHKTDNRILVDSFGCGIYTACADFLADNSKSQSKSTSVPAYHLIQSFAPGEVTFEEAHQIGQEFAQSILENKRAFVLATHVDREHVHNHIIFCSTDFMENKRFNDDRAAYYHIRSVSDRLCKDHNLSVIEPGLQKGKKYNEWLADRQNNSYKLILKRDIFECIRHAADYNDFLRRMTDLGYQIKGYEIGENAPKYISFKPKDYGNFIRGCKKNLGKGHTKEEIIERIEKQIASREAWIQKQKEMPLYSKSLIDTSAEKYQENERLKKKASLINLQIAASAYANIGSLSEMDTAIGILKEQMKENRSAIVAIDKEKKVLSEQLRYMKIYSENKPFHDEYLTAKNPDEYLMRNESRLTLFDGAINVLKSHGINPEQTTIEEFQSRLAELDEEREKRKAENESLKPQLDTLLQEQKTLNSYLHREKDKEQDEEQKRKQNKQKPTR